MYKILGADQKEYGPVEAEQIRAWIAQGRANGQTRAQIEGGDWQTLSAFPEFAEALAEQEGTRTDSAPAAAAAPASRPEGDYRLDILGCFERGWELVKEDFGAIVGTTLLVLVIATVLNQFIGYLTKPSLDALFNRHFSVRSVTLVALGSLAGAPVYSVFYGGLYWFYLKKIRGAETDTGDAFAGFGTPFVQLALLGIVKGLLLLLGFALCIVPGIYLSVAWLFCEPLIIDKQLGFWEAMELSRQQVSKHWLTVFCLTLLAGVVMIGGVVMCLVGMIVTIPIAYAAMMFAYEDIFHG